MLTPVNTVDLPQTNTIASTRSISIVSPVYRAEKIAGELVRRLEIELKPIFGDRYEIILVDDRSPDKSWEVIKAISEVNAHVKSMRLSRNFGQHYAITAGLDHSTGDLVVVMDCDLQDRPEEIPNLLRKLDEGYDFVIASRKLRQDSFFKKFFSRLFHIFLTYLSGTDHDTTVANFGIYNRAMVNAIGKMRESIRYFPTMRTWVGYSGVKLEVEHSARFEGETTYNFKKLINLAIDIILAYSDKPMRIFVKVGFIVVVLSFMAAIGYIVSALVSGTGISTVVFLLINVWFFFGLVIAILGIIGLYIGKIFENVKQRPIYLVDQKVNFE